MTGTARWVIANCQGAFVVCADIVSNAGFWLIPVNRYGNLPRYLESCFWLDFYGFLLFYYRQAHFQFHCSYWQISSICSVCRGWELCLAVHIMCMSPVLGSLTRLKTRFLYKVIVSILASISGFIMTAFQKCFSRKTILLVFLLHLKCLIRRLFYLAFQMLVMKPVVLTLLALRKFPTACGTLLSRKRALHGENLKRRILL